MEPRNNPHLIRAKRLLLNYFKLCWPKDEHFFNDNRMEIEAIAAEIVDAAVEIAIERMKPKGDSFLDVALNERDGVYRP